MSEPVRPIKIESPEAKDRKIYDVLVIDKSTSMTYQKADTINGVNKYIQKLREDVAGSQLQTFISVIQFGSNVETMIKNTDIKEVPELTDHNYAPAGMTALNDAVYAAITLLRKELAGHEGDDNIDVTISVFTDGDENHSTIYPNDPHTRENASLKNLIKELTENFKWTFTFTGAGRQSEVARAAHALNISNTVSYNAGVKGVGGTSDVFDGMTLARSAKLSAFANKGTKLTANYFTNVGVVGNAAPQYNADSTPTK